MLTRYKPIPNIALLETAAQIRQAMRKGNMAEAVNLFHQTAEKESASLFETFAEAQQQYESKRIGIEEWWRKQVQTCQSILGTGCMLETEMRETPSSQIKAGILQLLHKHKTEQALAMCEGFGDDYLLLHAQLYAAKNEGGSGLIESEYFEATKSKVNDALEALMGQIPEPTPRRGFWYKVMRLFG